MFDGQTAASNRFRPCGWISLPSTHGEDWKVIEGVKRDGFSKEDKAR